MFEGGKCELESDFFLYNLVKQFSSLAFSQKRLHESFLIWECTAQRRAESGSIAKKALTRSARAGLTVTLVSSYGVRNTLREDSDMREASLFFLFTFLFLSPFPFLSLGLLSLALYSLYPSDRMQISCGLITRTRLLYAFWFARYPLFETIRYIHYPPHYNSGERR